MQAGSHDERGVSEFAGIAILVALTVLVTASVGLYVAVVDEDEGGPTSANFSFEYVDASSSLLVTHERGDEVDAGNLSVRSAGNEAGWDALAGTNASAPVGPGSTVQISSGNEWGQNVAQRDAVQVVYAPDPRNETVLSTWSGS